MHLSQAAARALMLAATGLLTPPKPNPTKADVLACIRQMQVLQIDTIHVIARSPYLVLWSRLGAYDPAWLDALLEEGQIFEFWSHAACFLPIEDFGAYRTLTVNGISRTWVYSQPWLSENRALADRILDHMREYGPVRSADFERSDGQKGGWWNWKAEKLALEMLFAANDIMIARRENFQRIYDLRERVVPWWDDANLPSVEAAQRAFVLQTFAALGALPIEWVADYFRTKRAPTDRLVRQLAAEGLLEQIHVEGWKQPWYLLPSQRPLAEQAAAEQLQPTATTLLSPFDPLVWDRERASKLFGFDYLIECYTPASKRRYGYFTLPILWRGQLVGRLDPKAHRKQGLFEIKALHLEPWVTPDEALAQDLAAALIACAAWHRTPQVVIRASDPPGFAELVARYLST
ncbi:MAG: crosslink repair DNA glycosylase YcaQ family protein [Roseiflexaceae bacterium]